MTVLKEGNHTGEFIVTEANGYRSREEGAPAAAYVAPTAKVVSGTVVQLTADEYGEVVDAATDPVAVLYTPVAIDETLSEVVVIARDAEVARARLTFPAAFDAAMEDAAIARLLEQGIKVV